MLHYSCGIIPLQRRDGEWWVLLVQHRHGLHWSFPKGHPEPAEDAWQTAQRELLEETGLHPVCRLIQQPLRERYFIPVLDSYKDVDYFLAEVAGEIAFQEAEINATLWCPLTQASTQLTFPEAKALLVQIRALLATLEV